MANDRAPSSLWKHPLIFLCNLAMRSARSASLFENGTSMSVANRVASVFSFVRAVARLKPSFSMESRSRPIGVGLAARPPSVLQT